MVKRNITVDYIARVEGEASLEVTLDRGTVQDVKFSIFEPPRFFEALLRDRDFREAPDIASRICGICPIAYMMGAIQAMENICGAEIDPPLRSLRRLIYCGEWIGSHVLHVGMLHLPDFLGYPDSIELGRDRPELLELILRIKHLGNSLMRVLGGREIHPVNVRVGGFYRLPDAGECALLADQVAEGLDKSLELLQVLNGLDFPSFEQDYDFVALHPGTEYPFIDGPIGFADGSDHSRAEYDALVVESQAPYSTALQGRRGDHKGPPLMLGAPARFALNHDALTPRARAAAQEIGLDPACRNPFHSILVRTVEVIFAFEDAARMLADYTPADRAFVPVEPRAGTGHGCTEAPRGACHHRYEIDADGLIQAARIMPPTAVNQLAIERDLKSWVSERIDQPEEELRHDCERLIRNYDPCISCAAHFLKLDIREIDGR